MIMKLLLMKLICHYVITIDKVMADVSIQKVFVIIKNMASALIYLKQRSIAAKLEL
jgi:hypothetical protein